MDSEGLDPESRIWRFLRSSYESFVGFLINHRNLLIQNTTLGPNLKVSDCHHVYNCQLTKNISYITCKYNVYNLSTYKIPRASLQQFNRYHVLTKSNRKFSRSTCYFTCNTRKLLNVTPDVFRTSITINQFRTHTLSGASVAATSINSCGHHVVFEVIAQ